MPQVALTKILLFFLTLLLKVTIFNIILSIKLANGNNAIIFRLIQQPFLSDCTTSTKPEIIKCG